MKHLSDSIFKKKYNNRGLTMIEMLVVIAAIVMISALLMPALKNMRNSAKRAKCLNNLKQLGLAINMYLQGSNGQYFDWPGTYVDVSNLPRSLFRFLGQENENALWSGEIDVLECPSNGLTTDDGQRRYGGGAPELQDLVDYSINENVFGSLDSEVIGNNTITVVLYDYGVDQNKYVHTNGANFLFADGHVQFMKTNILNDPWPAETSCRGTDYETWGLKSSCP